MDTPTSRRQSLRRRESRNYIESPVESPNPKKLTRKSVLKTEVIYESDDDSRETPKVQRSAKKSMPKSATKRDESIEAKTPKSRKKSARKSSEDSPEYSPKKLRANRTPSTKGLEALAQENSPTMEKLDSLLTPRSVRNRKSNQRFSDINLKINTKEQTVKLIKECKRDVKSSPSPASDTDEDETVDTTDSEFVTKATTLFDDSEDVEGNKIYAFKTPTKKKNSMALLAQTTPKTPQLNHLERTPQTPKNSRLSEIQNTPTSRPSASKTAKTPKHIRERIKKQLAKIPESESDGDFSASEDDYKPDGHSSTSEGSSDDERENTTPPKKPLSVAARVLQTPATSMKFSTPSTRRSTRSKGDFQYVLQSDDYFTSASSKSKTSDHTLDRLKNPRLPQDELKKLLSNMKLSKEHEEAVKGLNEEYKTYFDKWLTLFDEGYTILLHGLGSKRNLLQNFHKEKLDCHHVIVLNGFFPSLTIKDILDSIWVDILENTGVGGSPHEIVNLIEEEMNSIPALHIFLIVHNIDGPMLRNDKAQGALSRLANIKNLHMIASIDHINTPLLWNNTKLSNFNFVWFDVTSFLPYIDETAFESSLLVQSSGALELSSMKSVFQSLTTNARGIFVLVVKYQIKNSGSPYYKGMSFKELYSLCREAFLVSSDVALRAQLTEFLDHKLAKMKRTNEGTENITIPIRNALLEQFLNEQC